MLFLRLIEFKLNSIEKSLRVSSIFTYTDDGLIWVRLVKGFECLAGLGNSPRRIRKLEIGEKLL